MNHHYETGAKLFLLNIALGLGTFIQVLDASIANVAVPYIAGNLSVSADQGTWVITSFSASNAVMLPLTGWLADYFGRVRLFVWSVLLFSLTSLLCGLAGSLTTLVIYRVLQGAVAGSLIPLSQSLVMEHNPPDKQGSALGFWGMIVIVAPLLGPIVGGYITQEYSWPWIFFINVPIGIFSAFIAWQFLKHRDTEIVRNPIDWVGLFFLAVGVACMQIMLDKGQDLDWFDSNVIVTLTIISLISISYFGIWTYFQKYPIVDFSFFKNRNFAVGTIAITVGYLLFFGSTVTVPLWLQTEQNYTALWAGIAVAPIGIVPLLLATTIGKNLYRFDLRKVISLSFIFFAIGFYVQSNFTTEVSLYQIMFARFLQGFGVAIFFLPLVQLAMGQIPESRYASATGLFNFLRILVGSGFGTSLSIALWTRLEIFHHQRLSEAITPYNTPTIEFYDHMKNNNYAHNVITGVIDKNVEQQAFMLSTNDVSMLAALLFLAMIPMLFLCNVSQVQGEKKATAE